MHACTLTESRKARRERGTLREGEEETARKTHKVRKGESTSAREGTTKRASSAAVYIFRFLTSTISR